MAENTPTSTQRSASATKSTARRKTTATKRSTASKRAAQTRAARSGTAARKRTTTRAKATATRAERTVEADAKNGFERVSDLAEKAALIQVGAVLTARDNAVNTVKDLRTTYGTRAKAERKLETQLRKLERRGETARKSLEREVKRTRTKVERQLRQRRTRFQRQVRPIVKNGTSQAGALGAQSEFVGAQLGNLAQTVATAGTQVASRVQERVAALS
jgi:soluble cytochrome b562